MNTEHLPPLPKQLELLLADYWDAGYDEGTGHAPEYDPNETLSQIKDAIRAYARAALAAQAQAKDAEPVAFVPADDFALFMTYGGAIFANDHQREDTDVPLFAAPVAQAEPWVPVTERLPEPDSGEVLIWLTGGRCAFDEWHTHREDPIGMSTTHVLDMGCMWRDYEFDEVTHWMPLPQPPKE